MREIYYCNFFLHYFFLIFAISFLHFIQFDLFGKTKFSRHICNTVALTLACHFFSFLQCGFLTWIDTGESVQPPFMNRNSKCCSSVTYQVLIIQTISKGSDQSMRMSRLVWAFAYRTYHIVGNLMLWLTIWSSLVLFIEMLYQATIDLFCFWAKSRGVCLFLRHIHKRISNSQHQEGVIHHIFKECVNLQSLVFTCFL